jgi:iron complex outermembrane receptor protein
MDYYNIELKNTITTISSQQLFDFCYRQGVQGFCDHIERASNGFIRRIVNRDTNLGGTKTAGIDLGARYKFLSTPFGDFTFNIRGTHVNYFKTFTPRGDGTTQVHKVVGDLDLGQIPEWKAIASLGWTYGRWSANITEHYLSDFTGRCSDTYDGTPQSLTNLGLCSDPNFKDNGESRNHVGSTTWYDVQVSYATPWNVDVAVGARNIFAKKPPNSANGDGFIAGLDYDLYSRYIYGQISYDF